MNVSHLDLNCSLPPLASIIVRRNLPQVLGKKSLTMRIDPFNPPKYLRNKHVQSIMNSVGPKKLRAKQLAKSMGSENITIATNKNIKLTAEFDQAQYRFEGQAKDETSPLVVLIHGWEGSSQSAYQVTTASFLLRKGFDVLRLNLRDHGDSHHLNREFFNSTLLEEVGDAIKVFNQQNNYQRLFLAGFSLGGNFTLRIAADRGEELGISAAVAICPPIDPNNAMRAMNDSLFIYESYFFKRWTTSLKKKLHHFPELGTGLDLSNIRTLEDINKTFIPRFTPFSDPESYFSAYAITGSRLGKLSIPSYLFATADDPILPITDVDKIDHIDALSIIRQSYGGHCGFISDLKGNSWIPAQMTDIFNQHR